MIRHHTGSGRLRVIPHDWSEHHRGVLETTRTATVTLRRPGSTGGTFNRTTGTKTGGTPHAPYFGTGATEPNARIQILPALDQQTTAAEQKVSTQAYAIMLDHAVTGIQLDDVLDVAAMDNNGDPWLVGKHLVVSSIEGASLHWERRLVAILDLETPTAT